MFDHHSSSVRVSVVLPVALIFVMRVPSGLCIQVGRYRALFRCSGARLCLERVVGFRSRRSVRVGLDARGIPDDSTVVGGQQGACGTFHGLLVVRRRWRGCRLEGGLTDSVWI